MRTSVKDIISGGVLFGLAGAMFVGALGIKKTLVVGVGSGFVPLLVAVLLACVSVSILMSAARALPADREKPVGTSGGGWPALATFVLIALYVALLERLGFVIATALYLAGQFAVLAPEGKRRPARFAVVAVLVSVAIYYLFVTVFDLMLPSGWLG